MSEGNCRFCGAPLAHVFADLGMTPLSNAFLTSDRLNAMEPFYPLRALVCERCFLVQLGEFESPETIFGEYAYFSSYSSSWVEHARAYAERVSERFKLGPDSLVVEVASNDGYLLQHFRDRRIPVLGIEPARNVAKAAIARGIPTEVRFFGRETAYALDLSADLLVGNNVLAHVPDLNDFVAGLAVALAPEGVITMEFPHLLRLIQERQFDTIYHEHFSYFSLLTADRVFTAHDLQIFDVDELPTHGGSLRIYACRAGAAAAPCESVGQLLERERAAGLDDPATYRSFADSVRAAKRDLLAFFIAEKREGRSIAGYGAPAKGNTLLNYCGIGTDFIDYTVDANPYKQGRFLPGTHIPIKAPDELRRTEPDLVFILPWNLRDEVMEQVSHVHEWGGRFAVGSPEITLYG